MRFKNCFFTALMGFALFAPAPEGFCQGDGTNTVPNRYLLVLDVSAPMKSRAAVVQEAVTGMFMSGMHGELKDGDQIGIWTFNDRLHTGEFDLVIWKTSESNEIVRRVLDFIKSLRYEKETQFKEAREEMLALVADSRRITVILISDGDEVIQGTPFDLQIRRYFEENANELKARKVPVITVLRGYKGQLVDHGISYPPWPIELPAFPEEPEPPPPSKSATHETDTAPQTNSLSRALVSTNKGPVVYAEPLIVSGKRGGNRSSVTQAVKSNTLAGETQPVQPTNQSGLAGLTNEGLQSGRLTAMAGTDEGSAEPTPTEPDVVPETESKGGFWGLVKLVALGVLGLVVVAGLLVMMRRKPRSRSQTSLITRSMTKRRPRRPSQRR